VACAPVWAPSLVVLVPYPCACAQSLPFVTVLGFCSHPLPFCISSPMSTHLLTLTLPDIYHHHQTPAWLLTKDKVSMSYAPSPSAIHLPPSQWARGSTLTHLLCGLHIHGTVQWVGECFSNGRACTGSNWSWHISHILPNTPYFCTSPFCNTCLWKYSQIHPPPCPLYYGLNKNMNTYKYDQGGTLKI